MSEKGKNNRAYTTINEIRVLLLDKAATSSLFLTTVWLAQLLHLQWPRLRKKGIRLQEGDCMGGVSMLCSLHSIFITFLVAWV